MALTFWLLLLLATLNNVTFAALWKTPVQSTAFISSNPQSLKRLDVTATKSPTLPSSIAVLELLKRQSSTSAETTCGWVSGYQNAAVTCTGGRFCYNDSEKKVHGCCKTDVRSLCSIATTCIASSDLSALCTDASCSDNSAIQKCFLAASPECYTNYYFTSSDIFTGYGCAPSEYTATVLSTFIIGFNSTRTNTRGVLPTSSSNSSGLTTSNSTSTVSSPSLAKASSVMFMAPKRLSGGAIAGVVISVLAVIGFFLIAALFLIHRKKDTTSSETQLQDPTAHAIPYPNYGDFYAQPTNRGSHGTSPAPHSDHSVSLVRDQQSLPQELPARGYSAMSMEKREESPFKEPT